ncbi:hypothetical protein SKAU_G00216390 [Synaphobranchus kaupii]|uniref:Uncharacterized protein n=1 Tax=Synaphobranchus kaupii TaxID=118154 RepID=A0A9Q1FA44_SYNKA|nr:hypothetical protein SKAU_G00216390 [Synaphobranchus kaupii]
MASRFLDLLQRESKEFLESAEAENLPGFRKKQVPQISDVTEVSAIVPDPEEKQPRLAGRLPQGVSSCTLVNQPSVGK